MGGPTRETADAGSGDCEAGGDADDAGETAATPGTLDAQRVPRLRTLVPRSIPRYARIHSHVLDRLTRGER